MSRPDPKAAILAATEDGDLCPCEGFDGVFIRRLSIEEMDRLAAAPEGSGVLLLRLTLCDDAGELLFGDDDLPTLRRMKVEPYRAIYRQVVAWNRIGDEQAEDALKN